MARIDWSRGYPRITTQNNRSETNDAVTIGQSHVSNATGPGPVAREIDVASGQPKQWLRIRSLAAVLITAVGLGFGYLGAETRVNEIVANFKNWIASKLDNQY